MKSIWKGAVERFVLNHLERLGQEQFNQWLQGDLHISSNMESTLLSLRDHRDAILRELLALSPAEILDIYQKERPENQISDKQRALVRIGNELQAMKACLMSL